MVAQSLALSMTFSVVAGSPPVELSRITRTLAEHFTISQIVELRRVGKTWNVFALEDGRNPVPLAVYSAQHEGGFVKGMPIKSSQFSSDTQKRAGAVAGRKVLKVLAALSVTHEDLRFLVTPLRLAAPDSFGKALESHAAVIVDETWMVSLDLIERRKSYLVVDSPGQPLRIMESCLAPPPDAARADERRR